MKLTALASLLLTLLTLNQSHAATITITCTNVTGQPDTNVLRIYPVSTPIFNGTWTITGIPQRGTPNTNGVTTLTNQAKGNYYASNSVLQFYYAVPDSTNRYAAEGLRISGGNVYNYTPALTAEAIQNSGVVTNGQLTVLSNTIGGQIDDVASSVYSFNQSNVSFTVSSANLPWHRVAHCQYGIDTLRTLMRAVTNYTFRAPLADTNAVDTNLIAAIRTQGSNNCIVLTNGVYYIGTNAVRMSAGSVLIGQSMSNVVIYGRGPAPDNSSGVLRINDGCTVANLTASTIPSPASPKNYTKALEFFGGGSGNDVTNTAYLINTLSFSDSDTIRGGGKVQVVNSCVHGKWDGFFLESLTVTNPVLIYNCYGFADDTSLNPDILLADVHALRLTGLKVSVWYSDFVATDNVIGNGSVAAAIEPPCTANFYECTFTCGTNGAANDGDFTVEIGSGAFCTLAGGSYDPAKLANHGNLTIQPSATTATIPAARLPGSVTNLSLYGGSKVAIDTVNRWLVGPDGSTVAQWANGYLETVQGDTFLTTDSGISASQLTGTIGNPFDGEQNTSTIRLVKRAAAPTPGVIGAGNGWLWVSNTVLYYSYTANGTTSNSAVKIAP